ncbi:hypothetical protein [Streptomyces sp. NRRL S-1448]|uniref:hypothetical protein n=1 Tax=Streptomyces sp. NRRL S-1448 TaxID=1463883 RepID=UPI0004C1FF5B|nr:hypothetical protein [Streptomyces sp. NRRL S-1448]
MLAPRESYDSPLHPDLLVWLTERQADFARWGHEAGGVTRFDLSDASLDVLEDLVGATYTEMEEITQQRRTPFALAPAEHVAPTARRGRRDGQSD